METDKGNINYKKWHQSSLWLTTNIKAWILTALIIGIPWSLVYKAIKDSPKVIQVSIEDKTRNWEEIQALPSNYKEIADSLNKIIVEHWLGNIASWRKRNYVTYTLESKDYNVGTFEEIIYIPQ